MSSIVSSLRIAIVVLILLMLGLAVATWYGQNLTEKSVAEVTDNAFPSSLDIGNAAVSYQRVRRYEKEYFVFLTNKERRDGYTKQWDTSLAATTDQLDAISLDKNKRFSKAETAKAQEWRDAMQKYGDGFKKIRAKVDDGTITDGIVANAENGVNVNFVRPFDKEAPEFANARVKSAQASSLELKNTLLLLRNVMFGLILLVIAYLAYLALSLPKKIIAPLALFSEAAERMSKGDLKTEVSSGGVVEFETLEGAMERLRKALGAMMERMRRV